LSSIGYVASSWSRVIVPNIIGLTALNASTQIISAGLSVGTVTTTTSGATSGNNGTVATQEIPAGTDVERSTSVAYATYNYIAPPPVFTAPPPGVLGIWYAYCEKNSEIPSGPNFTSSYNCVSLFNELMQLGEIGGSWSCASGYDNDPNKAGITAPDCTFGGTPPPAFAPPPPVFTSPPPVFTAPPVFTPGPPVFTPPPVFTAPPPPPTPCVPECVGGAICENGICVGV
jgi:hypothetical protein